MTPRLEKKYPESANLIDQVDDLADQVKTLALNLAITLAREKSKIKDLYILEPEFTQLINKSVGVIREITKILRTLRADKDRTPQAPIEVEGINRIEAALEEILHVSQNVLKNVRVLKQRKGSVDRYK